MCPEESTCFDAQTEPEVGGNGIEMQQTHAESRVKASSSTGNAMIHWTRQQRENSRSIPEFKTPMTGYR